MLCDGSPPVRPLTLSISAVERDTGLSKDTLRVWERRCCFPTPKRDSIDERTHTVDQDRKLRTVGRLKDGAHRPERPMPVPVEDLGQLSHNTVDEWKHGLGTVAEDLRGSIKLLRSNQIGELRRHLQQLNFRSGLQGFLWMRPLPLIRWSATVGCADSSKCTKNTRAASQRTAFLGFVDGRRLVHPRRCEVPVSGHTNPLARPALQRRSVHGVIALGVLLDTSPQIARWRHGAHA